MIISSELASQVFSLSPEQRYTLAQQLLDSIDEEAAAQFDAQFIAELNSRREEMLRGFDVVDDWRTAIADIEASLGSGSAS
jgi:hypothetical protein